MARSGPSLGYFLSRHVSNHFKWKNEAGEKDIKFEAFAKENPAEAKQIHRQLALLSQALFEARGLEDKYGIQPTQNLDRVGLPFVFKSISLLTIVGTERSRTLPPQRRVFNNRNPSSFPGAMPSQLLVYETNQVRPERERT